MTMPRIEIQTKIKSKKEIVFDLIRSIDLHTVSTSATNEKAIAGRTSGLIELNETVTWRAKHLGVYQTLTSIITASERPHYFVDEQKKGIFKSFKHEHLISEENGVVLSTDYFTYESPLGFLGKIADYLFLEKYMTRFLETRNKTIKEFAESGKWKEVLEEDNYSIN